MKSKIVYMCATDWNEKAFKADSAPEIFKSLSDIRRKRLCSIHDCGIVEIELVFRRVRSKPKKSKNKL